jgi:hypothetical protein
LRNFRPGKPWIDVITNVDRVEILFLHPCRRAIYRYWNVGADNLSITWEPPEAVEDDSWGEIKFLYRD